MRHFLTLKDYTKEEILEIVDLGLSIKENLKKGIYNKELENKTFRIYRIVRRKMLFKLVNQILLTLSLILLLVFQISEYIKSL